MDYMRCCKLVRKNKTKFVLVFTKYLLSLINKQLKTDIMKRYDYRNDYKNWTKEQMQKHLPILREKLLKNIGVSDSNADNYSKRISYLNSKINKDA